MSEFYKPTRTRNIYNPESEEPFKLSRSKIENFLACKKCFYLDRRLGIGQPPGFPFNLNSAVDKLLKKEFDIHRAKRVAHPLMKAYGLSAVPFSNELLDEWRENFKGVQYLHESTNLIVTGAVDDLWQDENGEIIVADYKATSKDAQVNLDADWQDGYKRQMEIYQWLLRRNGLRVSDTGYFVYCNGKTDRVAFDGKLEFDINLLPYTGDDSWIEGTLKDIKKCLDGEMPDPDPKCDYCNYRIAVREVENK